MIKNNLPYLLAPIPIILLILALCVWIYFSPEQMINGQYDNAPDRAVVILIFVTPIIIYPSLVATVFIQSLVMKIIHQENIKGCILVGIISSIPLALFIANATNVPQFGESLLQASIYSIGINATISCTILIIFLKLTKLFANKSANATKC